MARNLPVRAPLVAGQALLFTALPAKAALFTLQAVAVNGVPIPPTKEVVIAPGDVIQCEVRLSGWGDTKYYTAPWKQIVEPPTPCEDDAECAPNTCEELLATTYQATLDCAGFTTGTSGTVRTLGLGSWSKDCAYVDVTRPDFIFYEVSEGVLNVVRCVDTPSFGGALFHSRLDGVADPGAEVYLGTFVLAATTQADPEDQACGTFTIGLRCARYPYDPYDETFLAGYVGLGDVIIYPPAEPVSIVVQCGPTAACCYNGSCSEKTQTECTAAGGIWYPTCACRQRNFLCPQLQPHKAPQPPRRPLGPRWREE